MSFDPAALVAIHCRLLEGDPTASADLFELLYGPLIGHAIKKHAAFGMDQDRARDLAVGVLASIVERPNLFDPQKGSLFGFLCMMVDGDAQNAGRDEANRHKKFSQFAVEVEQVRGNFYMTSPEIRLDAERILSEYGAEIVVEAGDQEVLRLILEEGRNYEAYAVALGISHLPPKQMRAEIKRRKDRIEKRLRRLKDRL
jgi:hypothetical protein